MKKSLLLLILGLTDLYSAPRIEIEPVVLPDENFSSISVQDELITKKLEVTERAIICKDVYLCNVTIGDDLLVEGNLSVEGSTVNLGGVTFTDLTVTGDALINNESVTGNLTVDGTLSVGGPTDLSSLSVTNDADIGCNLTVGCNIFTQNTNATIGAYYKGGLLWLHNRGTNSTFLGINAGNLTLSGANNVGIGDSSLIGLSSGANNTAIGQGTLLSVNIGNNNIAIGSGAGGTLIGGSGNIYIGANAAAASEALTIRIGTSQTRNFQLGIRGVTATNTDTAIVSIDSANQLGTGRIYNDIDLANTTATQGAILKNGVLWLHDSGSANVFLGQNISSRTSSGNNNTGVGGSGINGPVFDKLNGGTFNTAIGVSTLANIDAGTLNTAVGSNALFSLQAVANQSQNTAVGSSALAALQGGTGNIGIGYQAGNLLVTGSNNIHIGTVGVGNESGIIRIGSNGIHTTCFTAGNLVVGNNLFVPGMSPGSISLAVEFTLPSGILSYIPSSKKFKENIEPLTDQAAQNFMQLQPVTFNFNYDTAQKPQTQYGFIAEDVNKIMPELVIYDEQGEPLGLNFKSMYALLLKLIQKQQNQIDTLQTGESSDKTGKADPKAIKLIKTELADHSSRLQNQESMISKLQEKVTAQDDLIQSFTADIAILKAIIESVKTRTH